MAETKTGPHSTAERRSFSSTASHTPVRQADGKTLRTMMERRHRGQPAVNVWGPPSIVRLRQLSLPLRQRPRGRHVPRRLLAARCQIWLLYVGSFPEYEALLDKARQATSAPRPASISPGWPMWIWACSKKLPRRTYAANQDASAG